MNNDYKVPEHLKFRGSITRLGDKSDNCLKLGELFEISVRGFTPRQFAHTGQCRDCKLAYAHYMRLRRAQARDKQNMSMKGVPLPDTDRLK